VKIAKKFRGMAPGIIGPANAPFVTTSPGGMEASDEEDLALMQALFSGVVEHVLTPELLGKLEAADAPPPPRRGYGGTPRTRSLGGSSWGAFFSRLKPDEFRDHFRLERPLFDRIANGIREHVESERYAAFSSCVLNRAALPRRALSLPLPVFVDATGICVQRIRWSY
jgi:hypothetical protein